MATVGNSIPTPAPAGYDPASVGIDGRTGFVPRQRIFPLTWWLALRQPRKCLAALANPPVAIRVDAFPGPALPTASLVVRWTYDRREFGDRLCLWFATEGHVLRFADRWQSLARHLWRLVHSEPRIRFHDVAVDISDGGHPDLPPDTLCFARRIGDPHPLLPNAHLLAPRPQLPPAIPFDAKTDRLYFRGSSTGHRDFDANARVLFCRTARTVPRSDCGISRILEVDDRFAARLHAEGLVGSRDPVAELNRHRFIADVDGNSSSWDRFATTGRFGGVPIRFEGRFEEHWHGDCTPGEHFAMADRNDLAAVVDRLRSRPDEARRIAAAAAAFAGSRLSPAAVAEACATAWRRRIGA